MVSRVPRNMDIVLDRSCYHCQFPVPEGSSWLINVGQEELPACCPGCRAVGQAIIDAGYGDYYQRRTAPAPRPVPVLDEEPTRQNWTKFIQHNPDGGACASLIIHDIHCAACVWLIEERLSALPGVYGVYLNYSTHRVALDWDPAQIGLHEMIIELARIGYRAMPYDKTLHEDAMREVRREQIRRIAVSGVLGMQVMMLATALYFGDARGMDPGLRALLTWTSMLLCIPIVLYSARPFFEGSLRDIRNRRIGMDVPVSLGVGIAFAGSVTATVTGEGPIYFESVAMFVLLLLVARHFQQTALHRNILRIESLGKVITDTAVKLLPGSRQVEVAVGSLIPGDIILVRSGCSIPADGRVISGTSSVDESLLSGEGEPVVKSVDDLVLAGSTNMEQPLEVRVTVGAEQGTLAQIMRLVERAMANRPAAAVLADRVAGRFIQVVLVLASCAAVYWYQVDPAKWLPVTVSILVITCPCALSLAAPTAFTAAINALGLRGLATLRADALSDLARVDHVIFDKTGTLTESDLRITSIDTTGGVGEDEVLHIATSLEAYAHHPIARALRQQGGENKPVRDIHVESGAGLRGEIDGTTWYLGTAEYIRNETRADPVIRESGTYAMLANRDRIVATIYFENRLRDDARAIVSEFQEQGVGVSLYSGDTRSSVKKIATSTGIADWEYSLSPAEKMELARKLQRQGKTVAMVGDGINDAPVLAVSNVSVAMAEGASMAQAQSDFIVLNGNLDTLVAGRQIARSCARVLKQNFIWAICYNALAIPAAVVGIVPPWLATIGMSASSLLVVANSLRIGGSGR